MRRGLWTASALAVVMVGFVAASVVSRASSSAPASGVPDESEIGVPVLNPLPDPSTAPDETAARFDDVIGAALAVARANPGWLDGRGDGPTSAQAVLALRRAAPGLRFGPRATGPVVGVEVSGDALQLTVRDSTDVLYGRRFVAEHRGYWSICAVGAPCEALNW